MSSDSPLFEPDWLKADASLVWHPYSAMNSDRPVFPVVSAEGVRIKLADGRELIDGMASWWSAIHGYNHPVLNAAVQDQLGRMSHVMFGGLTHEPAVRLAQKLVDLTPGPLQQVFFSDSGSVSVEVAIKLSLQYWQARRQPQKNRLLTVRHGYHGDTFGAMSVSDPENGMHSLFAGALAEQLFAPAPQCRTDAEWDDSDIAALEKMLAQHAGEIAAVIIEPLVQGAGGMRVYCAEYLRQLRRLCDVHDVLLVFDEIATGFGRTGHLFAADEVGISPDIMCVGKALTGGYMSLAATLMTPDISKTISDNEPGLFMHGPTFMANPLACAVALASIELLESSGWQQKVRAIEQQLQQQLLPCAELESVADVRVKGAIGVIETRHPVDMAKLPPMFVERGVWVRPFNHLVYIMPPYVMGSEDLSQVTAAMTEIVRDHV